ncbi:MAG: hypothetical protein H0W73_16915 [Bacteroidetes bacterium]|nr:hypothetical protein [Bacteroidota bacterium]
MALIVNMNAQKECLDEVLALLKKDITKPDSGFQGKTFYTNYVVKVTDWDNEIVTSNVKTYSKDGYMDMQSEQANVYQDDKEVMVILPTQQLAFLNETSKQLNSVKFSGAFYEMRYDFFNTSIVERCDIIGDTKVIHARVDHTKNDESVKIDYFKCTYNFKTQKVVSLTFDYLPEYKIKQYTINYIDYKEVNGYKFLTPKSHYFNTNGKPLDKYKNYTFQDNRKNGKQ